MATLLCFGLGYSAEHFVGMFGDGFERIVGTVRGAEHAAVLNARFGGRLKAFAFDGTFATPEVQERDRRSRCRTGFDPADRQGRSGACGFRRSVGAGAPAAVDRLFVDGRSLWRPRRRLGGRGDDTAAGFGARARTAGRGTRLARVRPAITASPSPSCGSPAFMDPGATRSCRSRAAMPGASSSPARSSTASTSPTSPRRSMRRWRARPPASSTSPTTSRARPAIRSCSRRSFWAAIRRRKFPSQKPRRRCRRWRLSFWQECRRVRNDKLKRELGVTLLYPTYREGLRALFAEEQRAR